MIRRCGSCKEIVSGVGEIIVCMHCGKEYTKEEHEKLSQYYKIAILGKSNGPNHFVVHLTKALKKMGHEVVNMSRYDILKEQYVYDLADCQEHKKPMSLRYIEFKHSPDFIFVEQTYQRYNNDCTFSKVIYHHREYTHYPDLLDPDILTFAYPKREDFYECYFPYEYSLIKHKADLWCGVDMSLFYPKHKIYKGIINIGWHIEPWRFATVNGPVAKVIIEEQARFFDKIKEIGIVTFPHDTELEKYMEIIMSSEAILIDGGDFGWLTRRVFEAAASKTLMFIRLFSEEQKEFYEDIGLIHGKNCFLVKNEKEVLEYDRKLKNNEIDVKKIIEEAYEWVKYYDIKKTTKRLVDLYEKFYGSR